MYLVKLTERWMQDCEYHYRDIIKFLYSGHFYDIEQLIKQFGEEVFTDQDGNEVTRYINYDLSDPLSVLDVFPYRLHRENRPNFIPHPTKEGVYVPKEPPMQTDEEVKEAENITSDHINDITATQDNIIYTDELPF